MTINNFYLNQVSRHDEFYETISLMLKKMGFIYPIYEYANCVSQQLTSRAEMHSKTIICLMLWGIINLSNASHGLAFSI